MADGSNGHNGHNGNEGMGEEVFLEEAREALIDFGVVRIAIAVLLREVERDRIYASIHGAIPGGASFFTPEQQEILRPILDARPYANMTVEGTGGPNLEDIIITSQFTGLQARFSELIERLRNGDNLQALRSWNNNMLNLIHNNLLPSFSNEQLREHIANIEDITGAVMEVEQYGIVHDDPIYLPISG